MGSVSGTKSLVLLVIKNNDILGKKLIGHKARSEGQSTNENAGKGGLGAKQNEGGNE